MSALFFKNSGEVFRLELTKLLESVLASKESPKD